jgi:hypothetical protein|eukprot:scaffold14794_cov145-Alexandrium_tamarense.AAC.1
MAIHLRYRRQSVWMECSVLGGVDETAQRLVCMLSSQHRYPLKFLQRKLAQHSSTENESCNSTIATIPTPTLDDEQPTALRSLR